MGRPPYWKKTTNDPDYATSGIQKLTHLVRGSPSSGFVNFPRRKSKLYFASICGWSVPGKPQLGEMLGGKKALLTRLSEAGYKVSWKKAQVCQQEVRYLGSVISEGHCALVQRGSWLSAPSSAEDQEGGRRTPRNSRMLSHLDTQIFKPGQTTV
jgi:hypothetical protein